MRSVPSPLTRPQRSQRSQRSQPAPTPDPEYGANEYISNPGTPEAECSPWVPITDKAMLVSADATGGAGARRAIISGRDWVCQGQSSPSSSSPYPAVQKHALRGVSSDVSSA